VGVWRVVALWRSLAINGAARARASRVLSSVILATDDTGCGGVLVAFIWTWWDGVGVAVVSPWNKGGRGGCPGVFVVVARVVQGTVHLCSAERGE